MDAVARAEGSFREFEHTGDTGVEIDAHSRADLFALALVAVAHLMVEPGSVRPLQERVLSVEAATDADLMHDLLSAAVNLFLTEGFIWGEAKIDEREGGLDARLTGEPFDPGRHFLIQELKAITYHGLLVESREGRWHARVIIDV